MSEVCKSDLSRSELIDIFLHALSHLYEKALPAWKILQRASRGKESSRCLEVQAKWFETFAYLVSVYCGLITLCCPCNSSRGTRRHRGGAKKNSVLVDKICIDPSSTIL